MTASYTEERKNLILSRETKRARQLAFHVIEKPQPRVWMIFIPVFFVFYFWKLKQYESGLNDFTENHLIPRRRTLDAVLAAEEENRPVDIESLVALNGQSDEQILAANREWLTRLADHFRLLLTARGSSYAEMVRSAYRTKTNYILSCRQLAKAEEAYDLALLPTIEGDTTTLRQITESMAEGTENLFKTEAEEIFRVSIT